MIRSIYYSPIVVGTGVTTVTIPDFPVTGGNPRIVVYIASGDVVSAVSWNGQPFTKDKEAISTNTVFEAAYLWSLAPSGPGTYDITVTVGTTRDCKVMAELLNDAAQSSYVDGTGSATNSTNTLVPSITTALPNTYVAQAGAWIVSNSGGAQINGTTLNDSQTLHADSGSGPLSGALAAAYKLISSAGTNNFSIQANLNGNTVISIEEAATVIVGYKESISIQQGGAPLLTQLI